MLTLPVVDPVCNVAVLLVRVGLITHEPLDGVSYFFILYF